MGLTDGQYRAVEIVERTMSVVSLLGTFFIIGTFVAFPQFRKPINRLILFASFGNVVASVGTSISISGIRGTSIALCTVQGFLVQWFLPADSLWTFCMAVNVWLTFFKHYNATKLRRLEKWYCLFCYGLPLVPALVYLIVDKAAKTNIYGPATIWCWVSVEWTWMRIAFFYAPVWFIIVLTTSIYATISKVMFMHRSVLQTVSARSFSDPSPEVPLPGESESVTKMTEINVMSESRDRSEGDATVAADTYFSSQACSSAPTASPKAVPSTIPLSHQSRPDSATISWPMAPISTLQANDFGNNMVTTCSSNRPLVEKNVPRRKSIITVISKHRRNTSGGSASHINSAAWAYAKVALLMFFALCVVWIPSTVNRVYSLVHPDQALFRLNLVAAAVLPTQGFWNFLIYVCTSSKQCQSAWRSMKWNTYVGKGKKKDTSPGVTFGLPPDDLTATVGGELSGGSGSQFHRIQSVTVQPFDYTFANGGVEPVSPGGRGPRPTYQGEQPSDLEDDSDDFDEVSDEESKITSEP
ncbi:hypothetical protein BJ546DRAFT_845762 [Cryomyces antarcticus]